MEKNYGIVAMLLLPVLGGMFAFYLGKHNKNSRNVFVDGILLVEMLLLIGQGYSVLKSGNMVSFVGGVPRLGIAFHLDLVRIAFSILTTVVFGVITQFMKVSIREEKASNRFYLFYMWIYAMALGAWMTENLCHYFFFLVIAWLCAYPLIVHRQGEMAVKNARIYMTFLVAAMILIIVGLLIAYLTLGSVGHDRLYQAIMEHMNLTALLGGWVLFFSLAIFSGMFPLQLQVTRGSSYGLIEASAVLSTVLSKLGIFGMIMLAATVFADSRAYGQVLLLGGVLTIGWGIVIALSATDIRKILMGLNVAGNGFIILAVGMVRLCGATNGYALRSCWYMLLVSTLSLLVLYMVALEQVRIKHTYEIKGLIASGKRNKLLAIACCLSGASFCGFPGTAGFLAYSALYKSILHGLGWKWLVVLFILQWAFMMTAVVRVFMKLFVSKKDETIRILTDEETLKKEREKQQVEEEKRREQEKALSLKEKKPYLLGEIMLIVLGIVQIIVGICPGKTIEVLFESMQRVFHISGAVELASYYTKDTIIGLVVVIGLCILLYVNLVHGILLRVIRNRKNKELQMKQKK